MADQKYKFSDAQRYAVWLHHEKRCWFCKEPLPFEKATVDHVIPESILSQPKRLAKIIEDYDLPKSFQINGYENWLPAHSHCNGQKTNKVFSMTPSYRPIFERLIQRAANVQRTTESIERDRGKAKVLTSILTALEKNNLSLTDITDLIAAYSGISIPITSKNSAHAIFIRLDNGYFIDRASIAFEGWCECEKGTCVGKGEKVYCYWPDHLSSWAKQKRLFHRCFDELVECPRCGMSHRRGDIGRSETCGFPYSDQVNQVDLQGAHKGQGGA